MKKIRNTIVAVLLLLTLGLPVAFADVNPNQMGDPGGKQIAEILQQIQNNQPSSGAAYSAAPSGQTSGSYSEVTTLPAEVPSTAGGGTPSTGAGAGSTGSSSSSTQSLDWYNGGYDLINANKSISVYDVNTGVTWGAKYINGKNHADVIPASQADATKIKNNKITGSYVRRPVIVTIAGVKYAGSMYAVGHGSTNYCNYFSGVMCIHFSGSQTHGSQKVDSDHQNAIKDALNSGY